SITARILWIGSRSLIIDGHNDLVSRLWRKEDVRHMHLETAAEAGFAGGFFALYVPSPPLPPPPGGPSYALPLPDPIPREGASRVAEAEYEIFCSLPVE